MENAIDARDRTPVHLWIVGGLALLWSAFGCYDYLMTRMRNTEYLAGMMPSVGPNAVLAWIDAFPVWAQFGWGSGVWGGLVGAILLLLRSRWAVLAMGLSLFGAVLGLGYQALAAPPLAGMEGHTGAKVIPYLIIGVALALFVYARSMRAKGVLR